MTQASQSRILVSLAAYGDAGMIASVMLNVLRFMEPALLALHTSQGSAPVGDPTWPDDLRPHAARLLANPVHVYVRGHNAGDVLPIHMLNVRLLLQAGTKVARGHDSDKIVLLPGNAVLFQPCGPIVRSAPMAFMPGQTFSDLWDIKTGALPLDGWPNASSPTWRDEVAAVHASNDTALRDNQWEKNLFKFFSDGPAEMRGAATVPRASKSRAILRARPLGWQAHEGTWYPAWFLGEALQLFNGTGFDPQLWQGDSGRCPIHASARAVRCNTEEGVLPSLAWQRHPKLVRAAAGTPPLVLRAFHHLGTMPKFMGFAATIEREVAARDGTPSRYCGYKFVRDEGKLVARCALLRVADTHTDTVTHTHTHTDTGGGGGGGASHRLSTAASAGTPRPDEALRETCASTRKLLTT